MDLHALIRDSFVRLADSLEQQAPDVWDQPSLCAGWRVRDVVAHMTMPARLSDEHFGAELATVGGDFQRLSDTIAVRDGELPVAEHLTNLRSRSSQNGNRPAAARSARSTTRSCTVSTSRTL